MSLHELSLDAFTEALASAAATPGGGSAAALSGALAASLVSMVARNTAANPSFAERADTLEAIAAEAESCRQRLVGLVDDDAAAFERVLAAFRLPKETAEEKAVRSREIQASYQAAVEAPQLVSRQALDVLALAGRVAELGNPNAVSDAGVAALLARTLQDARGEGARLRDAALATVRAALP
jgi:formiminotetrahydrofolate cyclodeaminase